MSINFIPSMHSSPSQPYYLNQGCEQVVHIPEIGEAQLCSPSTNAMCAEFGIAESQNSLQIHPIDQVEKTTATKEVYELSSATSIYRESMEIFSVDYFNSYYGLNINKTKRSATG